MRSVVYRPTERCPHCRLPPRWCVCVALEQTTVPLAVSVLVHSRESFRPSSTGRLIQRVLPAVRSHLWRHDCLPARKDVCAPEHETWILHPQGEAMPEDADPARVQLVLLDGAWREATGMAQGIAGWGRRVSLPMSGESRYWLRAQADAGRFSTVEALLFVLRRFKLETASDVLQRQFELHVYASLRSRGQKALAETFLASSPIAAAFPELLAQLNERRPRAEGG